MVEFFIAAIPVAVWLYLIAARGGFWLSAERDGSGPTPAVWPDVIAVIPARNEAEGVGDTVGSLLRQNYAGNFSVVLVDDQSTDGTADVARRAAQEAATDAANRLAVLSGKPLPAGWTGKLWAMKQGVEEASARAPKYLLFTDADIVYDTDALARLVSEAEAKSLVLNSLMVKLRCESFAERMLIPAFIFFFQMLYPFAWANRPAAATAAAAGGCMLARRDALQAAGSIEGIRGALIDDCALAASMKRQGPIRLSLTDRVRSIRGYPDFQDIRRMVARSAYAQLHYSPLLLGGMVIGLALTYLAPVVFSLFGHLFSHSAFGHGAAQIAGLVAWVLMAVAFQPTLRFYRLSPLWGLALPAIALVYLAFTLDSAYQHALGRGGMWKGRAQANLSGSN